MRILIRSGSTFQLFHGGAILGTDKHDILARTYSLTGRVLDGIEHESPHDTLVRIRPSAMQLCWHICHPSSGRAVFNFSPDFGLVDNGRRNGRATALSALSRL